MSKESRLAEVKSQISLDGPENRDGEIKEVTENATHAEPINEEVITAIGRLAERSSPNPALEYGLAFQPGEEHWASFKCGGGPHLHSMDEG